MERSSLKTGDSGPTDKGGDMIPFWSLRNARDCLLGGVGIFTLCTIGQRFYKVAGTLAAPLWPSSGLALALLLLGGWRLFPAITFGTIAATQSFGNNPIFSLAGSLANTLESLIGWFLMIRVFGFSASMTRVRDLLILMLAGAPWGTMVSAILCTLGLVATGAVKPDGIHFSCLLFWTGNVLGILIFTPLVLRIAQRWHAGTLAKITPAGIFWTTILCVVMLLGFSLENTAHTGFIPLAYLSFPLLVWLSYVWRRDVTPALALVTVLMVAFTATGRGPLVRYYPSATYAEMTIFVAVYAISCLILMAAVEEGHKSSSLALEHRLSAVRKEAELRSIRANLNPHFLFNSLNTIKALVSIDSTKAQNAIVDLSLLLRSSLRMARAESVPLGEELAVIRTYLDLQKSRFEERLTTNLTVGKGTEEVMLPPMLLYQLVENGIVHGIEASATGGEIRVESRMEDGELHLIVSNTGTINPLARSGCDGFGLRFIREQLEATYGQAASFEIRAHPSDMGKKSLVMAEIRIRLGKDGCTDS